MKIETDMSSKGIITRKEFKESITMNNLGDYHYEEVRQGFNHEAVPQSMNLEVVPQNLEPVRWMQPRMREELDNDLEEKDVGDYDRRCKKSSEYKINVYIVDFYGGMHVEEFLDWI